MSKSFHLPMFPTLGLILLLFSPHIKAATAIEVQSDNDMTTVVTDGSFARMNLGDSEYVIVDYRKHRVNVVNPEKQQVMSLDANKLASSNKGPLVQTSIQRLGAGIQVAGYATQKYSYSANGKPCGVIYGSMEVYQKQGIKELFQALKIMMDKQRAVLGGLVNMVDDCTLADMNVNQHVRTVGVPMRTDKNGRVETEIKSIRYDVNLPADTFVVPASYKTITMQDKINAVATDMSTQSRQVSPQVQQHGLQSPQMMQQMRRSQGTMRQYPARGY
ncbi:MAG: hypothetical protein KJN89_01185 [Gammaproteobacteria bacterium]|nr:hypothetical protein [Gammaproteobacteria bacterium]MBT8134459.1 hypothetical protein [Gammaproteobacteria bacterium]NNJ48956.1 hypothetical protein [Gammaproteobacteria bacterium]